MKSDMRKIYLIRHGKPDFPEDGGYCLGLTDMPLGTLGKLQARQLGRSLSDAGISRVFSSYLSRAVETAAAISTDVTVLPGLEEMYAGEWEGLSFSQISEKWAELFKARAENPTLSIPGSEKLEDGQARFAAAVDRAVKESSGDIAIVAHTTVIQSLISLISGRELHECTMEKPPYCSTYVLGYDGELHILSGPVKAVPALDDNLCFALLKTAVPENIIRHCRAVADEALRIGEALTSAGAALDRDLIVRAALLHDIVRPEKDHAVRASVWLEDLGYGVEAEIVRQHHGLDELRLSEAAVVFIADKCIKEDRRVKVAERFNESLHRCPDSEALEAHRRQAAQAAAVQEMINTFCGKAVIE